MGWVVVGTTVFGSTDFASFCSGVPQKGGFQKGWFWRMFPGTKKRIEGTFGCSLVPKTGTRVHADVPLVPTTRNEGTLAKTALLRNRPLISS